jgi:cyclic pyranopterin phosphate synthase
MSGAGHIDDSGEARMVDVSGKDATRRRAVARATMRLGEASWAVLADNRAEKGDVLAVARVAGIAAAKRTGELIPLCHPLPLEHVAVDFSLAPDARELSVRAEATCTGRTGVEMEAMTAAAVASLTVYDMLKGVDREIEIAELLLLEKSGGRSGHWRRDA